MKDNNNDWKLINPYELPKNSIMPTFEGKWVLAIPPEEYFQLKRLNSIVTLLAFIGLIIIWMFA